MCVFLSGIDIHLDTNIGKRLSALGHTLTSFAADQTANPNSEQDEEDESDDTMPPQPKPSVKLEKTKSQVGVLPEGLPDFVYDTSLDPKTRARLIEQEMNEQAKNVEVLKALGASHSTIEFEQRKFEELEAAVFHDFRQDIMKKIKRQSVKATAIKDKLGLGYKPSQTHTRSKSTSQAQQFMQSQRKSKDLTTTTAIIKLDSMTEVTETEPVHILGESHSAFIPSHQRALSFDAKEMLMIKKQRSQSLATEGLTSTDSSIVNIEDLLDDADDTPPQISRETLKPG